MEFITHLPSATSYLKSLATSKSHILLSAEICFDVSSEIGWLSNLLLPYLVVKVAGNWFFHLRWSVTRSFWHEGPHVPSSLYYQQLPSCRLAAVHTYFPDTLLPPQKWVSARRCMPPRCGCQPRNGNLVGFQSTIW